VNQLPWFPVPKTVWAVRQEVKQDMTRIARRQRKAVQMTRVLDYLREHPCLSTHMVAVAMDRTDVWASSHLQNLEAAGLATYEMKRSPTRDLLIKFWSAV
jgi:hypothetical protein